MVRVPDSYIEQLRTHIIPSLKTMAEKLQAAKGYDGPTDLAHLSNQKTQILLAQLNRAIAAFQSIVDTKIV